MRPASYDPGEKIRVTRDSNGTLHVLHGAYEIATIKRALGGGMKVEADGRAWRLKTTDHGWEASTPDGTTDAELRTGLLKSRLRVGDFEAKVSRTEVKDLLRLKVDRSQSKPVVQGEILSEPRTSDPHALIAFATIALVLDTNLEPGRNDPANGDNISAALRYGTGIGH